MEDFVVEESFVPDFIRFVTFETNFRDGFLNQSYVGLNLYLITGWLEKTKRFRRQVNNKIYSCFWTASTCVQKSSLGWCSRLTYNGNRGLDSHSFVPSSYFERVFLQSHTCNSSLACTHALQKWLIPHLKAWSICKLFCTFKKFKLS